MTTPPACARRWEAEALDDGRLAGPDRASFERHAMACEECKSELAALEALRQHLSLVGSREYASEGSDIARRRARRRLLREANARAVRPPAPRTRALAIGVLCAVAASGAVAVVASRALRPEGAASAPRREEPSSLPPRSVVVAVDAPPPERVAALPQAAEPVVAVSAVAKGRHDPSPPRPTAGQVFDEGVASFERGAYGLADLQFERFAREHGDDPRAEDAAYLRAVSRFRLGDREGAAHLARAYLAAYPAGLRRPEAARIAGQ